MGVCVSSPTPEEWVVKLDREVAEHLEIIRRKYERPDHSVSDARQRSPSSSLVRAETEKKIVVLVDGHEKKLQRTQSMHHRTVHHKRSMTADATAGTKSTEAYATAVTKDETRIQSMIKTERMCVQTPDGVIIVHFPVMQYNEDTQSWPDEAGRSPNRAPKQTVRHLQRTESLEVPTSGDDVPKSRAPSSTNERVDTKRMAVRRRLNENWTIFWNGRGRRGKNQASIKGGRQHHHPIRRPSHRRV